MANGSKNCLFTADSCFFPSWLNLHGKEEKRLSIKKKQFLGFPVLVSRVSEYIHIY